MGLSYDSTKEYIFAFPSEAEAFLQEVLNTDDSYFQTDIISELDDTDPIKGFDWNTDINHYEINNNIVKFESEGYGIINQKVTEIAKKHNLIAFFGSVSSCQCCEEENQVVIWNHLDKTQIVTWDDIASVEVEDTEDEYYDEYESINDKFQGKRDELYSKFKLFA